MLGWAYLIVGLFVDAAAFSVPMDMTKELCRQFYCPIQIFSNNIINYSHNSRG
jgi:hypothetical protein